MERENRPSVLTIAVSPDAGRRVDMYDSPAVPRFCEPTMIKGKFEWFDTISLGVCLLLLAILCWMMYGCVKEPTIDTELSAQVAAIASQVDDVTATVETIAGNSVRGDQSIVKIGDSAWLGLLGLLYFAPGGSRLRKWVAGKLKGKR